PVHLDRLWGSVFSFEGGRFFWKLPKRIPYPVTVSFGQAMSPTSNTHRLNAHDVRQAIAGLASDAVMSRKTENDQLHLRFIRAARKNWSRFAMADSTGRELTYGKALTASVIVSRWARKLDPSRDRERAGSDKIGVLLPSSCAG